MTLTTNKSGAQQRLFQTIARFAVLLGGLLVCLPSAVEARGYPKMREAARRRKARFDAFVAKSRARERAQRAYWRAHPKEYKRYLARKRAEQRWRNSPAGKAHFRKLRERRERYRKKFRRYGVNVACIGCKKGWEERKLRQLERERQRARRPRSRRYASRRDRTRARRNRRKRRKR